jgi:hypothetical protein
MKNEIAVPIYESLEALLAGELVRRFDLAAHAALDAELADEVNGDLNRVDDRDLKLALEGLTETNLYATAEALADLAAWFA